MMNDDRPATFAQWALLFAVLAVMIRETDRRLAALEAQVALLRK